MFLGMPGSGNFSRDPEFQHRQVVALASIVNFTHDRYPAKSISPVAHLIQVLRPAPMKIPMILMSPPARSRMMMMMSYQMPKEVSLRKEWPVTLSFLMMHLCVCRMQHCFFVYRAPPTYEG